MQKIRIDFDNPGLPQHISAVENDSQSRFFQATLYENGKAYTAPAGATYSIMYHGFGPQNQGWYDTINDGAGKRAACAVAGNVVTCEIARQALQVPGHVSIVLCVTTGKGHMLKSWPIECDCKNDRYDSTAEIQSFFYITQVSNADWTQAIQAWENLKNTIDPTLSLSGKAADAAKVGEAVNAEAERAKGVESQLKEDIDNDFFAFGKIPVKLESLGNVYFGYTHGDKNANSFEKVRFRTVVGKLYMIEATIQTNIPLFKCGAYYYPVSPISDVVGRVKARGYFFGDGNVMSINTVSTEEKNVYECEVHGISNITKIVNESKSAIESINHRFMWNTFKNLISKCICCGDSLTRGYYSASIPNENGTLPTYPKELAKITGWECTNAGRSGYDSIQWYSERFKLFDFSDKDVAVLFLGTNRGISSDYNDVLNGSTTGSAYRKIIEGIHEQNPKCKIYTLSCFSTSSTQNTLEEVNNNIQHISSLYNYVYFCDFQNNPYFDVLSDNVHSSETGIHFTPIGYKLMANAIYMLMVDSFMDNISDYDTPIS